MFLGMLNNFAKSEDGAVTVDFVVLTAMIVGMGIAVIALIAPSLTPAMSGVDPAMATAPTLGETLILGN